MLTRRGTQINTPAFMRGDIIVNSGNRVFIFSYVLQIVVLNKGRISLFKTKENTHIYGKITLTKRTRFN